MFRQHCLRSLNKPLISSSFRKSFSTATSSSSSFFSTKRLVSLGIGIGTASLATFYAISRVHGGEHDSNKSKNNQNANQTPSETQNKEKDNQEKKELKVDEISERLRKEYEAEKDRSEPRFPPEKKT